MFAAHKVMPDLDAPLAWGTIGWVDDGGQVLELGDGSGSETAIALVKVTLFRGRDPSQALDQTQAQGQQVLCQMGGNPWLVPPRGFRVLVANPEPHGLVPGNATVIAVVDPRASQFYGSSAQLGELHAGSLKSLSGVHCLNDGTATLGKPPYDFVVLKSPLADQLTKLKQLVQDLQQFMTDIVIPGAFVSAAPGSPCVIGPSLGTDANTLVSDCTTLSTALGNNNASQTVQVGK